MPSRPYKASHYLQEPQDRAAYLNEVLESGDFNAFLSALTNLAETVETDSATTATADFSPRERVKPETPNIISLNTLKKVILSQKQR
jgi:DNA-binding phage protein